MKAKKPEREGDVLGISNANPNVKIPARIKRGGGHAEGLDARERTTGIEDVRPGKGASGIHMGAGGEGTDVESQPSRPSTTKNRDE